MDPCLHRGPEEEKGVLTHYRHHRDDISAWITSRKAQVSFRLILRKAKHSLWNQFVSGLNSSCTSSQVWNRVRLLCASVKRRPLILLENGTHLSAPPEVAELLAETFATKSDGTSGDQQFMAHKVQSEMIPVIFPMIKALLKIAPFPSLSCRSHFLLLPLELLV